MTTVRMYFYIIYLKNIYRYIKTTELIKVNKLIIYYVLKYNLLS